ncbi:pogo transposable element, putative [Talaromyces marneffei ATCC 18224]|uniref:Pogo transposable element, putative n=2 Tax=Talaromyces marneffei TaxID=37727 RepID=B6QGQ3_TALMQ|nr:pogo transposable element, putative [Talaromyces marneffei ATCC 18224]
MTKKRTKSEPSYEGRISLSIDAVKNKKTKTIRQTARLFDVSEATLRNRLKGGITSKEAGIDRRKLTPTEEIALRNWTLSLERRGLPPRREMAREMVNVLLAERDKTKPPKKVGINWIDSFLSRNPDLKCKFARRLSRKRALCEDPTYGIVGDDIYNFDETRFAMGIGATAKVICSSDRQGKLSIIQPGNREWVTVVECVGSSGIIVPPLIIFKSRHNQAKWYTDPILPPDWSITHSPKGWTSDELGLQWLEKIFEPFTRPLTVGAYRLLILDGHSSHLTPEFNRACEKSNIITCCLPAYSSHILQPLDVGVFSVLKRLYGTAVENRIRIGLHHVDKIDFLAMLLSVRLQTYSIQNIKSGFSHTGIVPYDPQKVISQLHLMVQEASPVQSRPNTSNSHSWSSKTPYNPCTVGRQGKAIKKLLNMTNLGSNTPTSQALDQLLKGALITMHNAAMLTSENHKLRKAVDQLQKRHTCRTQALPNEGSLTVSEGRELAQALDQAHEAATVTNQPEPPLRAQRAPPRCSNC